MVWGDRLQHSIAIRTRKNSSFHTYNPDELLSCYVAVEPLPKIDLFSIGIMINCIVATTFRHDKSNLPATTTQYDLQEPKLTKVNDNKLENYELKSVSNIDIATLLQQIQG